jgi:hypothetical protein
VVLEKDGEDQLDRSCEKRSFTKSQGREEYPTNHKRWKANWIGHILLRLYLLKHINEGKIEGSVEVTVGRGRRRRKQLLDDLQEEKKYWRLKDEALDSTLWTISFVIGYGRVVRQTTERMNLSSTLSLSLSLHINILCPIKTCYLIEFKVFLTKFNIFWTTVHLRIILVGNQLDAQFL